MFTRAFPLLFVAAVAVSAGGQPPDPKDDKAKRPAPPYTAFPDLKPTTDGKAGQLPPLPTEPADATPLQKVRFAQLREGVTYLARVNEAVAVGGVPDVDERWLTGEAYRLAVELETDPAKRAVWAEARVRYLKSAESIARQRAEAGAARPQALHAATFARLQAEADLLNLKADAKKPPRDE